MDKDLILCNLRPGKVYLQEKWDVFIKKHRVSYIVIGSMPLFALIIGLVILISRHDVDGFMACTFLGVLGLLFFFGPTIIKYFRPKHYEISTLDGRLTIVENGVEALNTSIDSIKSIKFTIHQIFHNLEELTIYYINEKKRERTFKMRLVNFPDDELTALLNLIDPKLLGQN